MFMCKFLFMLFSLKFQDNFPTDCTDEFVLAVETWL